tara:strand:- start:6725 stop:7045 length:321 start_codon:yes stop_codon:yes gene_type:complete
MLTLLIAMQSVITVAFVHQSHETGTEYVSFDHSDDLSHAVKRQGNETSDKFPIDEFGCHHCCHCLGIFVFGKNNSLNLILSGGKLFEYGLRLPSALSLPHLRPPIL